MGNKVRLYKATIKPVLTCPMETSVKTEKRTMGPGHRNLSSVKNYRKNKTRPNTQ